MKSWSAADAGRSPFSSARRTYRSSSSSDSDTRMTLSPATWSRPSTYDVHGAGDAASTEIERFEFATIAKALGHPVVQLVHGEGSKGDKMDSLIKRYWWIHRLNEEVARLALFLGSDESSYCSGSIHMIDGGLTAG